MASRKKHAERSKRGYKEHKQLKYYLRGIDPHAKR
jgi:hypothetical protein